ncbi:MAG: hypothetical protein IPH07_15005 [Deltaproteobacteria bacterium]|nr:hypothetical protein [Deltaproteobacteria bacterium]MBP7285795.1 hypothetical protein [Nannocystaceae bacterium]
MRTIFVSMSLAAAGCLAACGSTIVVHDRLACDSGGDPSSSSGEVGSSGSDGGSTAGGGSQGSSGDGSESSSTGGEGSSTGDAGSTGGDDPSAPPQPTATCPTLVDGTVTFCPAGLAGCRDAVLVGVSTADGGGPLALHWHGTYATPAAVLASDSAAIAVHDMTLDEHGVMALPVADADALARSGNAYPYPWWIICDPTESDCTREDDFLLAREIVACAVEQELVDRTRLTVSGFSAGAVMTSHILDREGYYAAAVSWSGGLPVAYQPITPIGSSTAVLAIHGGATDVFCANGHCTDFAANSAALATTLAAAGDVAVLCNHGGGHSSSMGSEGASFLALADATTTHPWAAYPFGAPPQTPGSGGAWTLDHYCSAP